MWTRKELKARAKQAFNMNYWKTVLVSLMIAALLGGAFVGVPGVSSRLNLVNHSNQNIEVNGDFSFSQGENGEIVINFDNKWYRTVDDLFGKAEIAGDRLVTLGYSAHDFEVI